MIHQGSRRLGLLLEIVTLLCASLAGDAAGQAQGPPPGSKLFQDQSTGVSFYYPSIWETVPPGRPDDLFIGQAPGGLTGLFVYVNRARQHDQASLDTLAQQLPAQISAQPGAKVTSVERPKFCGTNAVLVKFDIEGPAGKLHSWTLVVLSKGALVNFNFFTSDLVAKYDTPVIEHVISTIRCNK